MLPCFVNRRQQPRPSRHIGHRDGNPALTTPCKSTTSESICHRDARKSFRIRSYAKCRVSPAISCSARSAFSVTSALNPFFDVPRVFQLSPLFSHSCALFCTTGAMQLFRNQFVAHSFPCNGGCTPFLPKMEHSGSCRNGIARNPQTSVPTPACHNCWYSEALR